MSRHHLENHNISRVGWLRAAVLGANDGLVSTASIIVGVAAAAAGSAEILLAGTAGLVAGAMSMAAGEYVSVSSQSDTEGADLARERQELIEQPDEELGELAATFVERGVSETIALEVARQLTKHDAIGAHAREELGITDHSTARPLQAAITSAITFAIGAAPPLLIVLIAPPGQIGVYVSVSAIGFLAVLGGLGAKAGGASVTRGAARVTFWGAAAMGATAIVGSIFGVAV
ncbi:MAG TPA: VIT family protein [Roseobacter sp.]|uniref:VIT family protein n=1 Tax=marine sediment metagenome TaxID=412755 RepID=A0A0F9WB67_9ZZZZ|nr:VIT family protein [Roseobacter sp.]